MDNLAESLELPPAPAELDVGRVVIIDDAIHVRTSVGMLETRKAASCLLDPLAGDSVLVARTGQGHYIVAVLERRGQGVHRLTFEGEVDIRAERVTLSAKETLAMAAGKSASLTTGEVNIHAVRGSIFVRTLDAIGSSWRAHVDQVSVVGHSLDTFVDRLRLKAKRVYRFVEGRDELRAATIDHRASDLVRVHGENAVITANHLAKIDAKQIHIG